MRYISGVWTHRHCEAIVHFGVGGSGHHCVQAEVVGFITEICGYNTPLVKILLSDLVKRERTINMGRLHIIISHKVLVTNKRCRTGFKSIV